LASPIAASIANFLPIASRFSRQITPIGQEKTMKILIAALTLSFARAAGPPQVPVYMPDDPTLSALHRGLVRQLVLKMYDDIGVAIRWEWARSRVHSQTIKIELRDHTPADFMPGAMAYALPYEGTHIVVFYDRIAPKPDSVYLLAHVIAHEIGHILEGGPIHSQTGIMKSSWSFKDQAGMRFGSLGFDQTDAERVRNGAIDRELRRIATRQ
jgi:Zn-dependent protease with chaperone function